MTPVFITQAQADRLREYLDTDAQAHIGVHGKWTLDAGKLAAALDAAGIQVFVPPAPAAPAYVPPTRAEYEAMDPIAQARALQDCKRHWGRTVRELAEVFYAPGEDQQVRNWFALLRGTPEEQAAVAGGKMKPETLLRVLQAREFERHRRDTPQQVNPRLS